MDLGETIELGWTQPVGYMDLYVLIPNPVLVLIPFKNINEFILMVLVGSFRDNFIGVLD